MAGLSAIIAAIIYPMWWFIASVSGKDAPSFSELTADLAETMFKNATE
ncbi:MAG: hypothetical protein IJW86_06510 [Clostridia bacterium]|nr:hypothetical protein [Clostridia bacterium]